MRARFLAQAAPTGRGSVSVRMRESCASAGGRRSGVVPSSAITASHGTDCRVRLACMAVR
ncbi:hypothetical protein GCM10020256_11070 [Streptomyces thermocoprophilus]